MSSFQLFKYTYLHFEKLLLKSSRLLLPPSQVKINTGYVCNLKCPLCPTGLSRSPKLKQLSLQNAEWILSRIGDAYKVSLFGWGEPFLNKDIISIIQLFKKHNCYVSINSNLNLNSAIIDNLCNIDFDYLSVSLDGTDNESNSLYRYQGSFDIAFSNMCKLNESKRGPRILEWQFLVSNKNKHLLDKAKFMAKQHNLKIVPMNIGLYIDIFYNHSKSTKAEWLTLYNSETEESTVTTTSRTTCHYMYDDPFIDTDGNVYPCCNSVHAPLNLINEGYCNVFGNITNNTLFEIWNSDLYQFSRALFNNKRTRLSKDLKPICLKCKVYLKCHGHSTESLPMYDDKHFAAQLSHGTE